MSSNGRRDDEGGKREDGINMKKIDAESLSSFSELFVNLSAAWFFTGILTSFSQDMPILMRIIVLTVDIGLGILCLEIGIRLRRLSKKYGD